ncbi:hypothetical protein FACS1894202_12120 [Clostridia bacterium]|nr:hypothetical protein FACS1894202_12120 [Clostridia bacterium]
MTSKLTTACFTGHREQRLPSGFDEGRVREAVLQAIDDGYTTFWNGGATGADMIAAEVTLDLRQNYPYISLMLALPCEGQSNKWTGEQRERHAEILRRADGMVLVNPFYTPTCMAERNRYMVERSSRLIAVWDGERRGGTWQTVNMAQKAGLEIVTLSI